MAKKHTGHTSVNAEFRNLGGNSDYTEVNIKSHMYFNKDKFHTHF